uniref:Sushi domain-containing protein n=1 Tax=Ciona savignyi TaxID=51511 RepID=H2Z956_CIOSA
MVVDVPEGTKYGNLLSSSCSGGYIRLNGSLSRFCRSDKKWSGTPLFCQRGCPTGSNHRNATPTTFDAGYAVGHQLLYSCNTGYVAVDTRANFRLTCQSDYTWTEPTFQCLLGVCPSLSNSTSTQVIAPAFTFGSRVTITCNTGYEMSASSVRLLCDRTQSNEFIWSPSVPQCNIKRCPAPAPPLNGRVNLRSSQPYNAVATYTCNSGYKLVEPAPVTRTCGDNRQWGTTPVCIESPDCGFEVPTLPTCSYTNNGWTRSSSGLTFDGNPGFFAKATVSATLTSVSLVTSQCLNFHYRVASSSPGSSFTLETTPQNGSPST